MCCTHVICYAHDVIVLLCAYCIVISTLSVLGTAKYASWTAYWGGRVRYAAHAVSCYLVVCNSTCCTKYAYSKTSCFSYQDAFFWAWENLMFCLPRCILLLVPCRNLLFCLPRCILLMGKPYVLLTRMHSFDGPDGPHMRCTCSRHDANHVCTASWSRWCPHLLLQYLLCCCSTCCCCWQYLVPVSYTHLTLPTNREV